MIYFDDTHTYLSESGVLIPSVTKVVSYITQKTFINIPPVTLDYARRFGTTTHAQIEKFLNTGEVLSKNEITEIWEGFPEEYKPDRDKELTHTWDEFLRLHTEHIGEEFELETQLNFQDRYAGRFDCFTNGLLIDFKTSSRLDKESLGYQLNFYRMALESASIEVKGMYGLWLPKKGKGKWYEVPKIEDEELLRLLDEFEKNECNKDFPSY